MSVDQEDVSAFLEGFGFSEYELQAVSDEFQAYRSIPGTTLGRYMNRVIEALAEEDRAPFLKGIIVGMAIRKVADALDEADQAEEKNEELLKSNARDSRAELH
jgi:sugar-specific transcriptional regulator TrmB